MKLELIIKQFNVDEATARRIRHHSKKHQVPLHIAVKELQQKKAS